MAQKERSRRLASDSVILILMILIRKEGLEEEDHAPAKLESLTSTMINHTPLALPDREGAAYPTTVVLHSDQGEPSRSRRAWGVCT
jgi:hypothetical protein